MDPSAELGAGPSAELRAGPSAELRAGPSAELRAGPSAELGAGALARLRRLQVLTILLLLAALGALAHEWNARRSAPPPGPPEIDANEVRAIVETVLAEQPRPEPPAPAPAPPPAQVVRVEPVERSWLCRIRRAAQGGGLEWKLVPETAWPPPPDRDLPGAAGWAPVERGEIALPAPDLPAAGLLHAMAIVRADKDTSEHKDRLKRLWLVCAAEGGGEQRRELVGPFFPVKAPTDDLGLKSAATPAAFAAGPGSRFKLALDADAVAEKFTGTLEVFVRLGPLLSISTPSGGGAEAKQ